MTKYQALSGYVLREWDGEYLLIPVKLSAGNKPQMAILNACGGFLWEALQESRSFGELLKLLTDEYEVTKDQAEADIREFLDMLNGFELLVSSES